jgi:DUF1365 family protein
VKSLIYRGETRHVRLAPVRHEFQYPLFYLALELGELETLRGGRILGIDRGALLSIRQNDYLGPEGGAIAPRLREILRREGFMWGDEAAYLVTVPRLCGYVFNPVTFYLIFDGARRLGAMVCEVNNTFGEKHLYVHVPPEPVALPYRYELTKNFYVSPFFDTSGRYTISVGSFFERLDIGIGLEKESPVFWAGLEGRGESLRTPALIALLARFPFTVFLTMTRIHLHAVRLRLKKLVPWMKPAPLSRWTVRSNQRLIHRLRLGIIAFWRRRSGAVD